MFYCEKNKRRLWLEFPSLCRTELKKDIEALQYGFQLKVFFPQGQTKYHSVFVPPSSVPTILAHENVQRRGKEHCTGNVLKCLYKSSGILVVATTVPHVLFNSRALVSLLVALQGFQGREVQRWFVIVFICMATLNVLGGLLSKCLLCLASTVRWGYANLGYSSK